VNPAKRQVVSQSSTGIPGGSEEYDQFGASLASAGFDRDGYADLADMVKRSCGCDETAQLGYRFGW
jgi:hypothetical protein